LTDERIYEMFIHNSGEIEIGQSEIRNDLKKKKEKRTAALALA